jgi:hypothetical protein
MPIERGVRAFQIGNRHLPIGNIKGLHGIQWTLESIHLPATIAWLFTCKLENVRGLFTTLKKIFFWNYARNTWQWDLLCVVILIFIFLTPKSWFASGERAQNMAHQSPVATTVVLSPEVVGSEGDKGQIAQRVRALTGRSTVEVVAVRRIVDPDGRTRSFEVDIR